ncbi:hypothetical protein ACTHR6_24810 [Ralstonia holmesii]|uniref:hypothetical protein n=1 Tax=Ralstonia TaxID=48736 RepID=UPI00046A2245|nr:hypothetical protein [Ralstonia pickettii]
MTTQEANTQPVADATTMRIMNCTVTCPHCEEEEGGWLIDPRGGEHKCESCGGVYRVPENVSLRF